MTRICVTASWLAALAFVLTGGAGADVASPELAYISEGDVWVASADGSGARRLAPAGHGTWAAWSPDGTRLAFLNRRDSADPAVELLVVAEDGTALRRLTEGSGRVIMPHGAEPVWSPDGTRLALLRREGLNGPVDIWTVAADGSGFRRVTDDRLEEADVQWLSRDELLYSTYDPDPAIRVIGVESRSRRLVVRGSSPALSPDRSRVAYIAPGESAVHVADVTGGGAPRALPVSGVLPAGPPLWSPDGSRIAFVGRIPAQVTGRFAPSGYVHLWLLDVRTGSARRITGFPGDPSVSHPGVYAPVWWPGGERLFFSGDGLNVIRGDGRCEQRYTALPRTAFRVGWRPGARAQAAPLDCVDLWTRASAAASEVARGQPVRVTVTVRNVGNVAASRVRLTLSPVSGGRVGSVTTSHGTCELAQIESAGCELGVIASDAEARVTLLLVTARPGGVGTRVTAHSGGGEPDVRAWNDAADAGGAVSICSIVGTWGNDVLAGTRGPDHICGRPGADRIDGARGNDRLEAGSGEDTVTGGAGRDAILGGGGRDVILVRDGERDVVGCGTERDTVLADRKDAVARDCERVVRR